MGIAILGVYKYLKNKGFAYSREYVYNTLERIGAGGSFSTGVLHSLLFAAIYSTYGESSLNTVKPLRE